VRKINSKNIIILLSSLKKTGGVYQEVLELATLYQHKKVYILLTDISSLDEIEPDTIKDFSKISNLIFIYAGNIPNKLTFLHKKIKDINPYKIYYYCDHNNCCVNALIQDYGAKNIVIFSIDHGFSLGLTNSKIDLYITKTPKEYKLLRSKFNEKVIYIPSWNKNADISSNYKPFNGHSILYTASASARFYKYESQLFGDFSNFIIHILSITKGKHFHYGPLPDETKKRIYKRLIIRNIPEDSFIHIEWENNIPNSIIENKIDFFIAPFPVGSTKLKLLMMSAGIPLLVYAGGITRLEQIDYLHPEVLKWDTIDSFTNVISHINSYILEYQSMRQKDFFNKNNNLNLLAPYIIFDKEFESVPLGLQYIDKNVVDIENILDLLFFK